MDYTYKDLKKKTVAELKEIAKGLDHEAVKGYTQMNKEHLLEAVCKALGVEMHEHHEVVGIDKSEVKSNIRKLKKIRDTALEKKDLETVRKVRNRIKLLKKELRRATV